MPIVVPKGFKLYTRVPMSGIEKATYSYQLFDISGKMLESGIIASEETSISVEALTKGNYILKVTETRQGTAKEVKSFKIIKN